MWPVLSFSARAGCRWLSWPLVRMAHVKTRASERRVCGAVYCFCLLAALVQVGVDAEQALWSSPSCQNNAMEQDAVVLLLCTSLMSPCCGLASAGCRCRPCPALRRHGQGTCMPSWYCHRPGMHLPADGHASGSIATVTTFWQSSKSSCGLCLAQRSSSIHCDQALLIGR